MSEPGTSNFPDFSMTLESPSQGVGLIRFADAGRRNQLCWAAVVQLADLLDQCIETGIRVVVLASDVPGHWFEHAWLQDLADGIEGKTTTGEGIGWFRSANALSKPPLVTIAAISGNTCGGGCELGWCCDLRVAEEQALFAQPEIRLGITPGLGGVSRLDSLVGRSLASEMVLSGEWVSARRIYATGAINRLVETGAALEESLAWARQLAALPELALRHCKQILSDVQELHLQEALLKEQQVFQASAVDTPHLLREQQAWYEGGGTTLESFKR
jgi:enoyl-CoA hydratase/carnithine racemase